MAAGIERILLRPVPRFVEYSDTRARSDSMRVIPDGRCCIPVSVEEDLSREGTLLYPLPRDLCEFKGDLLVVLRILAHALVAVASVDIEEGEANSPHQVTVHMMATERSAFW